MSVSNYTPGAALCGYNYTKLKNAIFLVSKSHTKDVHIDNGAAYIDDLSEAPMVLRGFNIQLNEESSLDERYKFTKSVTMSMRGYVSPTTFSGRYYVILQSEDGTYWMVNTDFPAKVTYTFNLDAQQNQTNFTFSLQSNYPTLMLLTGLISPLEVLCQGYNVMGVESLKLLETGYCAIDDTNKRIYTYGKEFQPIEFLKDTCSLTESFDGEKSETTIQFNIGFDAYKSSWHYNLIEFVENLYAAIVVPKNGDNVYYCGFNFGLQPNFTVQTGQNSAESDTITITLVEMSNHGFTAANDYSQTASTDTSWVYVSSVGSIQTYECVGSGIAKYLIQAEINAKGYKTGRYRVLEGYASMFPSLNIIGTFSEVELFNNPDCHDIDTCTLTTNIPNIITYSTTGCNNYTLESTCNWSIQNIPYYLSISPSYGVADTSYMVEVCNTATITKDVTGGFDIVYGNNIRHITVILTTNIGILSPTSHTIDCLSQNVVFTFDQSCPITVTSIDPSLTYVIGDSQLTVTVPRNYNTTTKTWSITVKDCNNNVQTVYIYQDKTYEQWALVSGYICVDGNSYTKERRYTGATSSSLVVTDEYRAGTLIQTSDPRCQNVMTRWSFLNHYYCVDGDKYKALEEQVSYDNGTTWMETGITKLGDLVEADSSWCDLPVTYSWRQSIQWQCGT